MLNYHSYDDPYDLVKYAFQALEKKVSRNTIEGFATKFSLKEVFECFDIFS